MTSTAADLIRELSRRIASAQMPTSADAEARLILATVTGVDRTALDFATVDDADAARARRIAAARADTGQPLQYLLGTAVSGALDLVVGPGVFIPRPETELLVDWAVRHIAQLPRADAAEPAPVVVDLCAGSGTMALEIAHARPDVSVHAVELHDAALGYLRRNAARRAAAGDRPIAVHAGDATNPGVLPELVGRVAVVVSNPPYVPAGAQVPREVEHFEPATALFGGVSGNDVIKKMVPTIAGLLRPGGVVACEHDESTQEAVAAMFAAHPAFGRVKHHNDLSGRPRFVTAERVRAHRAEQCCAAPRSAARQRVISERSVAGEPDVQLHRR